jgi:plasmid stabilization system protein ParE
MSDEEPNHGTGGEDPQTTYTVRLGERALRDTDAAIVHLADTASEQLAAEWRTGLMRAVRTLASQPRRFPLAPEPFRREVRQMIYRRTGNAAAYRILFAITGEEQDALDAPTVWVLHIRHAAARPLTRAQVRDLEAE